MNSEILIFQKSDGNIKIDVRLKNEIVLLFSKAKSTINEHIQNIIRKVLYKDSEFPNYWQKTIQ